ncbi:unnamed protein product [Rotaria socialis]|nr:unnamed protein product [Rotaria socialis]CAF4500475.1 unnamed protein product [Rotaria socialis]
MNTSLFFNSSVAFIDLPVLSVLSSSTPPAFTQKQVSPTDTLPEMFSGAKPRVYKTYETNTKTTVNFERISYKILPDNYFMSASQTFNLSCSHQNPSDVHWSGRAQQTYVLDVHGYRSIDDVPIRSGAQELYPNIDLSTRPYFILLTESDVRSDREYFYANFKRQLFRPSSSMNKPSEEFIFTGKHKRLFQ